MLPDMHPQNPGLHGSPGLLMTPWAGLLGLSRYAGPCWYRRGWASPRTHTAVGWAAAGFSHLNLRLVSQLGLLSSRPLSASSVSPSLWSLQYPCSAPSRGSSGLRANKCQSCQVQGKPLGVPIQEGGCESVGRAAKPYCSHFW